MSEGVSLFRVTRVVKRAGSAIGGRSVTPETGGMQLMSALAMAPVNPYLAAILIAIISFEAARPGLAYIASGGTTGPSPFFLVDPRMSEEDRTQKWILQKVFGPSEGEKLFQRQFGDKMQEIDLRGKLP